ncbi:MAG: DUF3368 domain-containing protein [Pseudomonadota bacterium]
MKRLIVSDATPIIAFSKINRLTLLQEIVSKIIIPEEVSRELFAYGKPDIEKLERCAWIRIEKIESQNDVDLLLPALDRGEAEVIILAKELKADLVVIDELTARKVAVMMELPLIGTIGLLIAARKKGLITKLKPVWDDMRACGIRYGELFYQKVLAEIGELK